MISGIVLAAGTGTRFGDTKQIALLGGKPLVAHAIDALRGAGVAELLVVVGHDEDAVRAVLPDGVTTIVNPAYRDGQATSLAAALHDVGGSSEAAVVLLADQPGVTSGDVTALIDGFRETRSQIVRSGFVWRAAFISRFSTMRSTFAGSTEMTTGSAKTMIERSASASRL